MNLEDHVRETIMAEPERQSQAGDGILRVNRDIEPTVVIEGRVNLDELAMAVVGALSGGP
jgi:hypothetical protein